MAEPSVKQLRYLVALSEDLHFGSAADRCGVSQPNLSAQIRELEKSLDVQLLERSARSTMLTAQGEVVVEKARRILEGMDDLLAVAAVASDPMIGRLRLGVIPTVAPYVLPVALPAVRKAYPKLELQLIEDFTDRLLDRLDSGDVDVVLMALPADRPGFATLALNDEPFVILTPKDHPLAARKSVAIANFQSDDLLLLQEGHCLRDQALEVCALPTHSPIEGSSLSTLVQMVANGLGITLLPLAALPIDVGRSAEVSVVPFKSPAPSRTLGLVWRDSSPHSDAFTTLGDLIRLQIANALTKAEALLQKRQS